MKNTFSRTLICGIIASSFILVNCQKAPTGRGVKGTAGTPQTPADKAAEAAKSVLVKCSPEFAKEYLAWSNYLKTDEVENLRKLKASDELNESQLLDLKDVRKQLESKIAAVEPEIKKMQEAQDKIANEKKQEIKKLDGCFGETEGKKKDILFQEIQTTTNSYIGKISKFDGVKSDRTQLNEKEIELKNAHSDVTKDAKFYVSEELNNALDSADMDSVYFKEGKALTGEEEKKKAIASSMLSVCYIKTSEGKLKDLDVTLDSVSQEKVGQVGTKVRYKIIMTSGGDTYMLGCDIPAKKSLAIGFREAMGKLLQSKEQREKAKVAETAKADAAKVAADAKKTEKEEKDKKAAEDKANKAAEDKAKKEIIEKAKKDNKKPLTDEEMKVALRKALEELQGKTKKPEIKVSKEKEIEDVTKADKEAADKEHKQREEANLKAMEEESGT